MPATRITQVLEKWLQVAFNDQRTALQALKTKDEEEHQGALIVGHSYCFAIKAAHDAIFSQEEIPEEELKLLDTPEKRVLYFATKLLSDVESHSQGEKSQLDLPGMGETLS